MDAHKVYLSTAAARSGTGGQERPRQFPDLFLPLAHGCAAAPPSRLPAGLSL